MALNMNSMTTKIFCEHGISEAVAKGVGKWMPEELVALAEKQAKK